MGCGGGYAAGADLDDRVIWRVTKDSRWAEGRVRQVPFGHELRILVGGRGRDEELLTAAVYRPGESAGLAEMNTGMRQSFEGKRWQLEADARVTPS